MSAAPSPATGADVRAAAARLSGRMSAASVIGRVLLFPLGVIVAAKLGPAGYGVLAVAALVARYSSYADLGMRYSLVMEAPVLFAQGRKDEARLLSNIVFTWFLLVAAVCIAVLCASWAFGSPLRGLFTLSDLALLALFLLSDRVNTFFLSYARAVGRFDPIAANPVITNILGPFVTVALVIRFRVTGALLAQLLVSLLVGLNFLRDLRRHGGLHLRITLPMVRTMPALKRGLVLFSNVFSEGVLDAAALTLLAFAASTDDVGQLRYALIITAFGAGMAEGINVVVSRSMLLDRGAQGREHDPTHFRRYLEAPLVLYVLFVTLALGFAYFGYEVIVRLFLPRFLPAIALARVACFAAMTAAVISLFRMYLNATDQLGRRLWLAWSGAAVTLALIACVLALGQGVRGAAAAMAAGYSVYAVTVVATLAREIYGRTRTGLGLLARLQLASLLLVLTLWGLTAWDPAVPAPATAAARFLAAILISGVRLGAYVAAALGLYAILFPRYRPHEQVAAALRELIARPAAPPPLGDMRASADPSSILVERGPMDL